MTSKIFTVGARYIAHTPVKLELVSKTSWQPQKNASF